MLPGHYGFPPGLDHCLVAEPQGNPIRCPGDTSLVLLMLIHRGRIKRPPGILPNACGPLKPNWPPDITSFPMCKATANHSLRHSRYHKPILFLSGPQLRRKCLPRSLSSTPSMPNFNNSPTTNLHSPLFSTTSTSLPW